MVERRVRLVDPRDRCGAGDRLLLVDDLDGGEAGGEGQPLGSLSPVSGSRVSEIELMQYRWSVGVG